MKLLVTLFLTTFCFYLYSNSNSPSNNLSNTNNKKFLHHKLVGTSLGNFYISGITVSKESTQVSIRQVKDLQYKNEFQCLEKNLNQIKNLFKNPLYKKFQVLNDKTSGITLNFGHDKSPRIWAPNKSLLYVDVQMKEDGKCVLPSQQNSVAYFKESKLKSNKTSGRLPASIGLSQNLSNDNKSIWSKIKNIFIDKNK